MEGIGEQCSSMPFLYGSKLIISEIFFGELPINSIPEKSSLLDWVKY